MDEGDNNLLSIRESCQLFLNIVCCYGDADGWRRLNPTIPWPEVFFMASCERGAFAYRWR